MSCLGNNHLKTWLPHKHSCEHVHPPQTAETLPCIIAETPRDGHSTEIQYFPETDVSPILFFSWLVGWGEQGERAKHSSEGPLPGREWKSLRAPLGWSPAMAEPFPVFLCPEGKGCLRSWCYSRSASSCLCLTEQQGEFCSTWVLWLLQSISKFTTRKD